MFQDSENVKCVRIIYPSFPISRTADEAGWLVVHSSVPNQEIGNKEVDLFAAEINHHPTFFTSRSQSPGLQTRQAWLVVHSSVPNQEIGNKEVEFRFVPNKPNSTSGGENGNKGICIKTLLFPKPPPCRRGRQLGKAELVYYPSFPISRLGTEGRVISEKKIVPQSAWLS